MNVSAVYQPPPWLVFQPNMSPVWALFIVISAIWIAYRVVRVFQKPAAEIDELLGHDIPPQPEIALSNIGTNTVTLYWKSPGNYHTPTTNHIAVNGVPVVEADIGDGAVTITGLVPGHHYSIRAIATNNAGYTSYSRLIQVQTVPLDGPRASKLLAVTEVGSGKRPSTGGRRASAPLNDHERERSKSIENVVYDEFDGEDNLLKLNQRLDALRAQQEDLEQQVEQETEEAEIAKASLIEERDKLKKHLDDKEKAHSESRKQLNDLERVSKAAQRKKSAKERDLQKKKSERQKMKEDIAQWASERESLRQQTEKLRRDLSAEGEKQTVREADAKKTIEQTQVRGKCLEDEIKEWGIKVKALEEEKRLESERQEEEEADADRVDKQLEDQYAAKLHALEQSFMEISRLLTTIDPELEQIRQRQRQEAYRFTQNPVNDYQYSYGVPRSARGSISQGMGGVPYVPTTFAPPAQTTFPRAQGSSPFSTGLTALNYGSVPDDEHAGMSQAEVDALTGGAMLSPTIEGLIPKNLLRDDPDSTLRPHSREPTAILSDLFGEVRRDPQSPASQNSGARSFLPSPPEDHASLHSGNISSTVDIGRAMNNLNDAAPRRSIFGSWVGKRNPRDVSARDPSALPTLTQGEPQSFSVDDDDDDNDNEGEVDGHRGHQRNLSTMTNPFSNIFPGRGSMDDLQLPSSPPARKPRFFGRKAQAEKEPFYGLDRQSSPRPTSTYSYDAQLLRTEPQPFPFANNSGIDILRYRNSPLGGDWNSMHEQPYSTGPSRRPSVQYGSTGNLSMGSSVLPKDVRPTGAVAPIGSGRPGRGKSSMKLNPAAQSFVTVFNRDKKTPKTEKNGPDMDISRRSIDIDPLGFSPDEPRISRDDYSVMTSTTDSHDSVGGNSLPSSDLAGSTTSTSTPKDNLLTRLTRKGSSSRFSTPWSKDRKDRDKEKHTPNLTLSSRRRSSEFPLTPSEADEEGSDYLGQSLGSAYGSTHGSHLGTPIEGKFDDRHDDGKDKSKDKSKTVTRGTLSSSWSKMMGGKRKKDTNTAMSETSESREDE